jgi:hypothetical protein
MAGYLVPGGDWWRGEARAVSFEAITRSGHFIKHGIGVILLCWRRVLRAMLIGGLLGVLVAELVASLMEWRFPPSLPAHVAALAFGLACGYGAGLTVLLDELLVGALDTVKWLGGEAGAGVRAAAAIAGREAGELRSGVSRLAPARVRGAPKRHPAAAVTAAQPLVLPPEMDETADAIAATEEFQTTAPRPRVNARPVPAGQLPRITWAFEQIQHTDLPAAAVGALPLTTDELQPPVGETLPPTAPSTPATPSTPSAPAPAADTVLPASEMPPLPLSRAQEPTLPAPHGRGLWSRISQKLVGEPARVWPEQAKGSPGAASAPQHSDVSTPQA